MKKVFYFAIAIFLASCNNETELIEKDSLTEKQDLKTQNSNLKSRNLPLLTFNPTTQDQYVLAGLVSSGQILTGGDCDPSYTVYASSGLGKVNYDRAVHIGIIATLNGRPNIVDGGVVIIPANKTVSNNVPVFTNSTRKWGRVSVKILRITDRGFKQDYTGRFELRNTFGDANNCLQNSTSFTTNDRCNPGGRVTFLDKNGNVKVTQNDKDGDGLCNVCDPDETNFSLLECSGQK